VGDLLPVGIGILRYDGTEWREVMASAPGYLEGIWGTSPSEVFAVGHSGTILHFDGSAWSQMTDGVPSGDQYVFSDVTGTSPRDVYAVGDAAGQGLLLHYDGSTWTPIASGTEAILRGAWVTPSGEVIVVGDYGVVLRGRR